MCFREKGTVHVRFLLGPAGSGKTHRCLAEIRTALESAPDGPPLVLIAPKQATFQLERQLLSKGVPGYTRLRILSFERLAEFVFEQLNRPVPELLSEEGRVMVLRSLLERLRERLHLFRATARLPGFARQLSQLLRELQQFQFTPAGLEKLAGTLDASHPLHGKLRDLALILREYQDWLKTQNLRDTDSLLDLAAEALRETPAGNNIVIAGLWLDGFARLTPQERQLLTGMVQRAETATLAFCLDFEPKAPLPWHSSWAAIAETFLRCKQELGGLPGASVKVETLARTPDRGRFANAPVLAELERRWARGETGAAEQDGVRPPAVPRKEQRTEALRIVSCPGVESEVEFAAREIRRFVRDTGARYRDIAVLLRSLEGYHDSIRRVFTRFDIPFFLDRRESVAHHPLAELTRYALRLALYNWEHEDWFGALKTGLASEDDDGIDRLENEALARGWRGRIWTEPIRMPSGPERVVARLEQLRSKVVPPFQAFCASIEARKGRLTGIELSNALLQLWKTLRVDQTLERWSREATVPNWSHPALHQSVWDQMSEWLRNVELAFAAEPLPLAEWLTVIEAGLSNLSVGVIPPALDQVLVGAVDRSRNPDLELVLVLGMNEGVFPAPPPAPPLLSRADRDELAGRGAALGPDYLQQIGLERYYGYIACTRARSRVVLTFAQRDRDGRELNPSHLIAEICRNAGVEVEEREYPAEWQSAEHATELIPFLLRNTALERRFREITPVPEINAVLDKCHSARAGDESLPADLVERIHGTELVTSVSALEEFASCPFKFFVGRGLRAEERVEFEIDLRDRGVFQHDILKAFHDRVQREQRRWRDLSPGEARAMVREAGEAWLSEYREGLFAAAEARRFVGQLLIDAVERLVETLVTWARQYQFDPSAVELGFGLDKGGLPAWRVDIDDRHAVLLRGRIDRVDLCRIAETGDTLAVVIDYKSTRRELDRTLLHHGLELQLLAYLGALSELEDCRQIFRIQRLVPAGAFYVALCGQGRPASTREVDDKERERNRRLRWQHRGRFNGAYLQRFDVTGATKGEQFRYALRKDGQFAAQGNEALPAGEFQALIARVKEFLREHGREIYAGTIATRPYRWRGRTACDLCRYRPVCRFDPWTQPYHVLRPPQSA